MGQLNKDRDNGLKSKRVEGPHPDSHEWIKGKSVYSINIFRRWDSSYFKLAKWK